MSRYENEDFSTIIIIVTILAVTVGLFLENKFHVLDLISKPLPEITRQ